MKWFLLSLTFAVSANFVASAQTPAPTSGFAVIEAVAIDSFHQDFLRGAVLTVEGAASRAVTDSVGRYRLDSVPRRGEFDVVFKQLRQLFSSTGYTGRSNSHQPSAISRQLPTAEAGGISS